MRTAKTLQILDANNNNISPATCVDSLYFELVGDNGTIYRMSLRNRTIVAADDMTISAPKSQTLESTSKVDLKTVELPYCYVTNATGSVFQMKTATWPIGQDISTALDNVLIDYCTHEEAENFIRRNDPIVVLGTQDETNHNYIIIDASNATTGIAGINFGDICKIYKESNYGQEYPKFNFVTENNFNTSIGGDWNITVDNDIHIGTLEDYVNDFFIYTTRYDISVNECIRLQSNQEVFIAGNKFAELSAGSMGTNYIYVDSNPEVANESISLISPEIYLYNHRAMFPRPDATGLEYPSLLNLTAENTMQWKKIRSLKIGNGDTSYVYTCSDEQDTYVPIKRLKYGGSRQSYDVSVNLIENTETMYFRYLRSKHPLQDAYWTQSLIRDNSAQNSFTDSADSDSKKKDYITLKTIAGECLFATGNSDVNIDVVQPTATSYRNKTTLKIITGDNNDGLRNPHYLLTADTTNITKINATDSEGSLTRFGNIFCQNNRIYATEYMATSDISLKENIKPIDSSYSDITPVEFTWIDTQQKSYGFIAQDLEEKGYNELVTVDHEGLKRVNYNAALSLAVAQLKHENNELRSTINEMKSQMVELYKIIQKYFAN